MPDSECSCASQQRTNENENKNENQNQNENENENEGGSGMESARRGRERERDGECEARAGEVCNVNEGRWMVIRYVCGGDWRTERRGGRREDGAPSAQHGTVDSRLGRPSMRQLRGESQQGTSGTAMTSRQRSESEREAGVNCATLHDTVSHCKECVPLCSSVVCSFMGLNYYEAKKQLLQEIDHMVVELGLPPTPKRELHASAGAHVLIW